MIIIFSDCGFIIVAIIFFLCGSYKVGEVIADFIVDNCYIILVVLLIATFLISLIQSEIIIQNRFRLQLRLGLQYLILQKC